ncbi:DUF423 domain-containing protein [uncultured Thiothrix sp.]|uniref:DUF423 domain-containing protein n=1 Tax=uncultured Thiothrix sp. TaxID=223185 RepID=UPI002632F6EF|nr:DUF423 domain-containing protein [uncultured Thiothrix sp.]HMT94164.1 DUF423 domain-containing protein [Thiolinea sp.]
MKKNYFLLFAALFGMLAVILGAFGAHGLEKLVDAKMLQRFHTGVEYHFYHTLALGLAGCLWQSNPSPWHNRAAWGFIGGILIFSGSLYAYVLTGISKFGMITPIGGLSFIVGWTCLAWGIWHNES